MVKATVPAAVRRRILAGSLATACGIVTFGFNPAVSVGAESHRHWDHDHGPNQPHLVSSNQRWAADSAPQQFRPTGLQEADTAGLWDGYQQDCHNCQSAKPTFGATGCGCDSRGKIKNPIYRVLDGLAGGIERAMRLDQRSKLRHEALCDDGCDAATLQELRQLDAHAVPMMAPTVRPEAADKRMRIEMEPRKSPSDALPAPERRKLPAPVLPDSKVDPFADEAAWTPGRNPAIERSAYFE